MCFFVISVRVLRTPDIGLMDYCCCYLFPSDLVFCLVDFIVNLPPSNTFDCICVIVDRFSKMAYFVPYKMTITSEDTAKLFIDNIYRYHGLPDDIISDRGFQFVSKFWQSLFKILQVEIKLSSAFHPQIDGQTEWINQVLKQYLHCIINYQQDN